MFANVGFLMWLLLVFLVFSRALMMSVFQNEGTVWDPIPFSRYKKSGFLLASRSTTRKTECLLSKPVTTKSVVAFDFPSKPQTKRVICQIQISRFSPC